MFNYLAGVTDDHDKNFSFVMSEDGVWRLSPAYDVTFTVDYNNRFIADRHAMSIEESDRLVSRSQFLKLAEENDVKKADSIISQAETVLKTFRQKAEKASIDGFHINLISEFIQAQLNKLKK